MWPPRGAERSGPPIDFFDLKGVVTNVLAGLGIDEARTAWLPAGEVSFVHPGKAALVAIRGAGPGSGPDAGPDGVVGVAGALHPEVAQACDLPGEVWVAELDLVGLGHYVPRLIAPKALPRFPAITRDIAVIVDEAFRAGEIVEEVRALDDPQIESVRLFDCYRGAPVPPTKKSLAYSIAYRSPDRTLTDDEVNALHATVLDRLAGRFRIEFRT
jgi:phenylalanyl-tRNA synthetase beta chain